MTFSKVSFGGNRVFFSLFTTKSEREGKDLFPSGVRAATGNGILQLKEKEGGKAMLNYIKKYRKTVSLGEMRTCGIDESPLDVGSCLPSCSLPLHPTPPHPTPPPRPPPELPLLILVSVHLYTFPYSLVTQRVKNPPAML